MSTPSDRPTAARPADRDPAGVRAHRGQLAGRLGRQLHGLVRGDLLDVPRDPLGAGDRPDRRHLPGGHGRHWHLVRQHRRPPPQAGRDPGVGRGVVRLLRRSLSASTCRPRGRVARRGQPAAVGVRRGADAWRDRPATCAASRCPPRHACWCPSTVRDRANGLVGTASGVSFLVTSVISGLLVAFDGMRSVLVLALVVMAASFVHVSRLTVPEPVVVSTEGRGSGDRGVDLRGTFRLVRGVPGLLALIVFSCFNNFLGGTFMALMDAYGLSLVSVQAWGLLWGVPQRRRDHRRPDGRPAPASAPTPSARCCSSTSRSGPPAWCSRSARRSCC